MAVNETGAIFKALSFDGESSRTYGIYITGEAVYNAPERDVEMVTIPGRNGAFALDKGRFENIEVTYPAGMFADTEEDFAKGIADFRNMLCSRQGYCRLTDEYNPDEFRLAVYKSGLEVSPAQLRAGEFNITFECKPQRYLMSGQQKFIVGDWGETEVKTGDVITFDNTSGIMAVKSAEVALEPHQDLNGYDKPWAGGNNYNLFAATPYGGAYNAAVGTDLTTASTPAMNYTVSGVNVIIDVSQSWRQRLFATGELAAGTYTARLWSDSSNLRASLYVTDSSLKVASVVYNQATSGWSDPKVITVTAGQRIAISMGAAAVTTMKTQFQVNTGSSIQTIIPFENICPITGASDVEIHAGTKNLLPNTGTTKTENNVTFTPQADGSVLVNSNGAASGTATYRMVTNADAFKLPAGSYIFSGAKNSNQSIGYSTSDGLSGFSTNESGDTITFTHDVTFNYIYIRIASGQTLSNVTFYPMIRFSSITDSTYEPFNENLSTTSLGTTVYGGSVDVVAGSGQSTYGNVDLGTLSYSKESDGVFYSDITSLLPKSQPDTSVTVSNIISSAYEAKSINAVQTSKVGIGYYTYTVNNHSYLYIGDVHYSTGAELKAALSGQTAVYELATPTTLTLTPTTIDTIQGVNYVWSPQGDITVEYGNDPNYVVNPTLFGCGPLIEAKGYGDITFNSRTITVNNETLGDVILLESQTASTDKTYTLGSNNVANNGDAITIGATASFHLWGTGITSISNATVTTSPASGTGVILPVSSGMGMSTDGVFLGIANTTTTFTKGTNSTVTYSAGYSANYVKNGTTSSVTFTVSLVVAYTASSDTVQLSATFTKSSSNFDHSGGKSVTLTIAKVNSSVSILGNPTYIDCDLGEAYKVVNDEVIPLNSYIDLGSDLPTLASGPNEITYDGTYTEVAVTPRWWIV